MKQLPQLYSFSENYQAGIRGNGTGAPRLVPGSSYAIKTSTGGAGNIKNNISSYSLFDVINDFNWTTTPLRGRTDIPEIRLKEKRLRANAFIAQAAYYGLALQGSTADAAAGLQRLKDANPFMGLVADSLLGAFAVDKLGGKFLSEAATPAARALVSRAGPLGLVTAVTAPELITGVLRAGGMLGGAAVGGSGVLSGITGIANFGLNFLQKGFGINLDVDSLASKYLLAYEGLYLTQDTNIMYRFPYFVNNWNNIQNSFSNTPMIDPKQVIGPLGDLYDMFSNTLPQLATTFGAYADMSAPGIYIEKPKFFDFGTDTGEAISFNFPLVNTGWSNYYDVCKNWQLLFMLMYQNRPNRRSRDLVDPPVIYEVSMPGTRYYPYAYIEEMKVSFLGSVRTMEIPVPYGSGLLKIVTQIPEAYDVTIRLRALTRESQNFLYSMLYDKYNVISVTNVRQFNEAGTLASFGTNIQQSMLDTLSPDIFTDRVSSELRDLGLFNGTPGAAPK